MAFKPNYRFERNQRSQAKAAKQEAKRAERSAKRASRTEVDDENAPDNQNEAGDEDEDEAGDELSAPPAAGSASDEA